jgi:hypothetical protein
MDRKAEEFRKRVREENRGRARIRWRYSSQVRILAMAHFAEYWRLEEASTERHEASG